MGFRLCRRHARSVSLALVGLALSSASLRAQTATETPVAVGALDSAPSLALGEPGRKLIVNGFGVAGYQFDANTSENGFDASALALSFYKDVFDHLAVFAQLTASREAASPFLADRAAGGSRDVSTDIDNLQLTWRPSSASGLDVTVGKFDSPLALERDDAPLNFQATASFTFGFARPVKLTGISAHDAFSPAFEGWAIVANGADSDTDNNQAKTAALYGLWSPSLAAHVGFGVIHGAEKDGTSRDPRTTAVATLLFQPAERVVWGGETVAGSEPHSAASGGTAQWFAQTLFVHARCGRHWAATLRGDFLDDRDGARTGTPQALKSLTFSPQYLVGGGFYGIFRYLERTTLKLPEVAVRLDLRFDRSTEPVFVSRADGVGRRDHASATLQTVFLF